MPVVPVKFKPGLVSVETPTLNQGNWAAAENIRFFQGMAQKDGGYVDFAQVTDTPRSLRAWRALSGLFYLASVGEKRTTLILSEQNYDITPITIADTIPVSIATTAGSSIITVTDTTNTPAAGEAFEIVCPIAVGGIVLQGVYLINTTGINQYTFTAAQQAAINDTGGVARKFSSTTGSRVVIVTLPVHNLTTGQIANVPSVQTVGGISVVGNYLITVLNPNQYTISTAAIASSTQTVNENGGFMRLVFFAPASGGTQNDVPATTTTSDNWGEFLLTCGQGGPVNVWMPSQGLLSPAVDVATAPQSNNLIFVAIQAQQLICGGTINLSSGIFDPMLLRWSDTGDYTSFVPAVGNLAGSFRLPIGSQITAGLAMVGQNLIWTDLALYSMQFLGNPLVWGFQPLGVNCGAIGPHSVGILASTVYWMGQNQFFVLGPTGPQQLECPVWDQVFANIDRANLQNVVCETDAFYGEVGWSVPQSDGTVLFVRVRPDPNHGLAWTASNYHHHTAWLDQNVFGAPIGGHESGLIDQHDTGVNAAGAALPTSLTSGMILISEGTQTSFVRDFFPDVDWLGTVGTLTLNLLFYEYPESTPRIAGPFTITPATRIVHPHGRARAFQVQWSGNDLDSNWRMGDCRYRVQADGSR